jgi:type VI secretion system protein ImpL
MLALDDRRELLVTLDQGTVDRARAAIAQLPLDEQAYALIKDGAMTAGLPDWSWSMPRAAAAAQVFATRDGSDLATLTVPGFIPMKASGAISTTSWPWSAKSCAAINGCWAISPIPTEIEGRLAAAGPRPSGTLPPRIHRRVERGAGQSDAGVDGGRQAAICGAGAAASASGSPILRLVKASTDETQLPREIRRASIQHPRRSDWPRPWRRAAAALAGRVARPVLRFISRTGGVQRILLEAANRKRGKGQVRAGESPAAPNPRPTPPMSATAPSRPSRKF